MTSRKPRALLVSLCAMLALFLLPACASIQTDPRTMHFPPVEISEPSIDVVTLDNGIRVYLLADRELPLIRISAMIRTGTIYTPDQVVIARFTGRQMRGGGVGDIKPDELDEALNFGAIILHSGIGSDAASAGLNTLTRTFPEALGYFADTLRQPRFDADRLQTAKDASLESIRRKNDNPSSIVRREFAKLLYGADHPLGYDPTVADVNAVKRQDLVDYHRAQIRPDRIMLGITGDFERESMLAAITDAFGDWQADPIALPEPAKLPTQEVRRVVFAHKPVTQVSIRVGHLSIQRDHPDYYALQLANSILGSGGFRSRLFNTVRTKHGLAYSVGSGLRAGQGDRGSFLMAVRTRADQAGQALSLMFDEVERLRTEPVPEAELNAAKEAFLNGFVFKSVTAGQVLGRRMNLDYYGMPLDELERLKTQTMAVTPADILRVAQTHLEPQRMSIVAVGDRDVMVEALAPFGTPVEVPLDNPKTASP
jgi:predicted Zn-dependent peptidase